MSDFYFRSDLFSEFDRLQRQMSSLFGGFPSSIRSGAFGAFPAVNIGSTDDSVEIVAFVPGINPAELDVSIDKGMLTISGERKPVKTEQNEELRSYAQAAILNSNSWEQKRMASRLISTISLTHL